MAKADFDTLLNWRSDQEARGTHRAGTISVRAAMDILLCIVAGLAIVRGAQLWYGWPTSQNEAVSQVLLPMQLMLFGGLAFSIIYIVLYPHELLSRIKSGGIILALVLSFLAISVVASVDKAASARGALAVISLSLPILLFRWRYGEVGALEIIRQIAVIIISANFIYCILVPHYGFMSGSLEGDMRGLFPHKNGFGHTMATMAILLLPSPSQRHAIRFSFMIQIFGFALAMIGMVMSHSSTALIQFAVGIGSILVANVAGRIPGVSTRVFLAFGLFMGILAIALFAGTGLLSDVSGVVGKDTTFSGRTYVWAALFPHIFDYPFTGHGFAMFRNIYYFNQFVGDVPFGVRSAHSTYIELLLNIGIPGTCLWLLLVLKQLLMKVVAVRQSDMEAAARNRSIAVIIMTLLGAATEAGQMLAPLDTLTLMLLALPLDGYFQRNQGKAVR